MGHVKEPKGVDFVIESAPLTDKARQEISEFIRAYKSGVIEKKLKKVEKAKQAKAVTA